MLTRDASCTRDLLWRLELPAGDDATQLADRLAASGWRDRSLLPILRDLEGPDGHRVVIVPRTGRVQLRICYVVPPDARAGAAARLAAALSQPG
ncbi:MAG: hypothetical protein KC933_33010 [Myxococcales bacterium]|nr:hypothetical protein [Myxococcales bacterium]MCB9650943.1 hypothetical protein [Deltaproteobacteria bacterium]